MNRETPRNKDVKAQEHDQGIRERSGWCSSRRVPGSSLRVRGGGWVTMNSHGVEISIAGGVVEMVRDPTPWRFFFFFFLYHAFIVFRYKKLRAALAMEKTKPINQKPKHKKPN